MTARLGKAAGQRERMPKLLFALVALLCVLGLHTAKAQDVRVNIQRLLSIAEGLDESMQDLEDDMEDIEDEIEDVDDEIEDFGEGIEDMGTDVQAVTTEMDSLREDVKAMSSVFEMELKEVREKVESETDKVKNWTQSLKDDTEYLKMEARRLMVPVKNDTQCIKEEIEQLHKAATEDHLEVKHNMLILANHTEVELRDMKEELTNIGSKVDSLEGELRKVTENHLEVRGELAGLQRDMNSTLYLLQELRSQLVNLRQENSTYHYNILPESCSELQSYSLSGYYQLRNSSTRVYCDMDRQSCGCGSTWGWMRVANIDTTDPNQQCPDGFRLRPDTTKRMCEMTRETGGCTSIVFPTHSVQYSRVCGRIQAYQYGPVGGFISYYDNPQTTVSGHYADGVSITHGQSPRIHIWTFVAALDEKRYSIWSCPCMTTKTYTGEVPPFIGNDYFCETGSRQNWQYRLYTEDPLWDGQGCGPTSSCCQFNSPPWFCKELPQPTTDDIEVRACRHYRYSAYPTQPNIPFDVIELYVQ